MRKSIVILLISSFAFYSNAQENQEKIEPAVLGEKYREDQFYANFTYNLILGLPDDVNLRGLTGGFSVGYMRDMPINKRRNIAIGLGVGVSFDQYGQNLFIGESTANETLFTVLEKGNVSFDTNRFTTAIIEAPLELRWRTSTSEKYKFWRIYAGVRVGYTYWYKATFTQGDNTVIQTDIDEFNPVRLTGTFTFGYNKINFFAAYSINPFFTDATTTTNETFTFQPLKLGLIFYIL